MKTIYFDMDGTLADLYGVPNWLDYLENHDAFPYMAAKAMVNQRAFTDALNRVKSLGYRVGVISWLSKSGTPEYNRRVATVKRKWLEHNFHEVKFDEIHIIPYGIAKVRFSTGYDILFDDEEKNRQQWNLKGNNLAFDADNIINILNGLR